MSESHTVPANPTLTIGCLINQGDPIGAARTAQQAIGERYRLPPELADRLVRACASAPEYEPDFVAYFAACFVASGHPVFFVRGLRQFLDDKSKRTSRDFSKAIRILDGILGDRISRQGRRSFPY
ncbi:TPA: hypothetical protein DEA21_05105 [Candidatus Uhrbacteria bacterium]|nr:hypothetical protein [Candidatus Uhrbacteria bacterium]HCU31386.1 hypothetical protein [Candidatus Uhrbacteria bacterium]